jgi:NAD(P)-dependent dehydrogenase (short-subunit alcohol dehydrogenase family)
MFDTAFSSRIILITGATSGTGYETARQLAERGATVLLHGRNAEEARAADRLVTMADIPASRLRTYAADFAYLEEVEALARRVITEHPHLDVLVNNAGIAAPERHRVTADGNEIALQVNFLAHYLLTCLLEPALTSDPGGRVVNVSSAMHRTASIQWSDPNPRPPVLPAGRLRPVPAGPHGLRRGPAHHRRSVHPGVCAIALLPLYANEGGSPPRARHTWSDCATRPSRSSTAPTTTVTSASSPPRPRPRTAPSSA